MSPSLFFQMVKAWGVGLAFAGLIVFPFVSSSGFANDNIVKAILGVPVMMFGGLAAAFTFGIILTFPLFVAALVIVFFLRPVFSKTPNLCLTVGCTVLCFIPLAHMSSSEYQSWEEFWEKFVGLAVRPDGLIYILPLIAAGYYLYAICRKKPELLD